MRVEAGSNQSESSLKLRSRDKEGSRLTSGPDFSEVMGGGSDDEDKRKGNRSSFFAGRMSDPTDIEMGDAGDTPFVVASFQIAHYIRSTSPLPHSFSHLCLPGLNTWSSPAPGGEWDAPRDPDEEAKHLLSSSGDDGMGVGIMKQTELTRFFQASWPSQFYRFMFWARPAMDIWGDFSLSHSHPLSLSHSLILSLNRSLVLPSSHTLLILPPPVHWTWCQRQP